MFWVCDVDNMATLDFDSHNPYCFILIYWRNGMKRIEIEEWAHGYIIRKFKGEQVDHSKIWRIVGTKEVRIGNIPYDIEGEILKNVKEWLNRI